VTRGRSKAVWKDLHAGGGGDVGVKCRELQFTGHGGELLWEAPKKSGGNSVKNDGHTFSLGVRGEKKKKKKKAGGLN